MSSKKGSYDSAALRASRDQRLAAQTDPKAEAARHEQFFLGSMSAAKEHFDWIVANAAWTHLGHETFASWWEARVMPIANGLGMRPTQDIARTVIEKVREEEAALPKTQRRTQQQIAAMVGLERTVLANRDGSRSLPRENARGSDLEEPPADESGEDRPVSASLGEAEDSPSSAADVTIPSATPTGDGSSPDESLPVDEPERAAVGVPLPALAPNLVNTPVGPMPAEFVKKLDDLVPDPNPHREWQKRFLDNVFAAAKAMRGYSGAEIAEKADDQLRAEFAKFVGDMESLLHETSQAQIAAANNVVRLRRVQ